jgi:hypothetical protein
MAEVFNFMAVRGGWRRFGGGNGGFFCFGCCIVGVVEALEDQFLNRVLDIHIRRNMLASKVYSRCGDSNLLFGDILLQHSL